MPSFWPTERQGGAIITTENPPSVTCPAPNGLLGHPSSVCRLPSLLHTAIYVPGKPRNLDSSQHITSRHLLAHFPGPSPRGDKNTSTACWLLVFNSYYWTPYTIICSCIRLPARLRGRLPKQLEAGWGGGHWRMCIPSYSSPFSPLAGGDSHNTTFSLMVATPDSRVRREVESATDTITIHPEQVTSLRRVHMALLVLELSTDLLPSSLQPPA